MTEPVGRSWISTISWPLLTLVLVLTSVAQLCQGQSFTLLYTFPGGPSGANPAAGVTRDVEGNLYGTAFGGGAYGRGMAFKLTTTGAETWLHQFQGSDGAQPDSNLLTDKKGNLCGVTATGGTHHAGTVFELSPNADGNWTETVLYSFAGGPDGQNPENALLQDPAGNLYGTTLLGGDRSAGTVFELTASPDGWTETVLHSFDGTYGSANPGLSRDTLGNLYGTTGAFRSAGTIFKLAPPALAGDSWTETIVYLFAGGTGASPVVGVIRDAAGNLFGTADEGGDPNCSCGVVFKLNPAGEETVLHSFTGGTDGAYPRGLIFGPEGNLYGTTGGGGGSNACNKEGLDGCGTVFSVNTAGTETVLYRFTGGTDGGSPNSGLIRDAANHLYGTTNIGGADNRGTLFMVTP